MALNWNDEELARGLTCYRCGEFFEAHEHWEAEWLAAAEPEKRFLQALIQTAAAFHHLSRGNAVGAASLLTRVLRKLEAYPEHFGGVDVAHLRREIEQCIAVIRGSGGQAPAAPLIR